VSVAKRAAGAPRLLGGVDFVGCREGTGAPSKLVTKSTIVVRQSLSVLWQVDAASVNLVVDQ
jgi:hypothetical protein